MFKLGETYTREYIASIVGGSIEAYLPQDNTGRVVAVCVRPAYTPHAPDIILPGSGDVIQASAREFCNRYPARTFVRLAKGEWMFVGQYRVHSTSADPAVIEQHQAKAALSGRSRKG